MPNASAERIQLEVRCEPRLARLVRMTAANVAALSSMSVDRIEDIRMAAEEAFIYACTVEPDEAIRIAFDVDAEHVSMDFELGEVDLASVDGAPEAAYADLILTAVCDSYAKDENPTRLLLELKADV